MDEYKNIIAMYLDLKDNPLQQDYDVIAVTERNEGDANEDKWQSFN